MKSKRHAKPTAAALLARIYRQNLEFKRMLLNQMAHIRLDIVSARREDREHMKTLIDHCARLLREKETLQRELAHIKQAGFKYQTTPEEISANIFEAHGELAARILNEPHKS